jgi:Peptidase A4 family
MLRRWCMPLAVLVLALSPALAAGSASAAAPSSHATPVRSGGPMLHPAHTGTSNAAESTNWSGYAADSSTYTSVSASWVEPTGTCTSATRYSSFWVGLDGYNSSTVEQTGTDTDCVNGVPQYYGWYEMYPAGSFSFGGTVKAGDDITASVVYEGSNEFVLTLADTTQNWSVSTTQTLAGAARSSAEVIIEAPCCTSSGGVLPLADFGTVNVSGSVVDGSPIGDLSPTQIIMVDSSGLDKDTVSSLSNNENFSATWERAS